MSTVSTVHWQSGWGRHSVMPYVRTSSWEILWYSTYMTRRRERSVGVRITRPASCLHLLRSTCVMCHQLSVSRSPSYLCTWRFGGLGKLRREVFHGFPHSLSEHTAVAPSSRSWSPPSRPFEIMFWPHSILYNLWKADRSAVSIDPSQKLIAFVFL
jgi:hypothetical protein